MNRDVWNFRNIISVAWPLVAGVIFTLILLGAWNAYSNSEFRHDRMKKKLSALSAEQKLAYWKSHIQKRGGLAAYDELGESIHHFSTVRQHKETHIFGRSLYVVEGLAGVATCDRRFMYACFHSFMTQAILKNGVTAAQELHTACKTILGSVSDDCEHGIGHGIMSMFEYNIEGLKKALAICDALSPPSHPVAGCAGGVFMEYGTRDMGNEGAGNIRAFVLKEVLEPCTSIGGPYLGSCAHWQTQWWIMSAPEKKDGAKMATNMGAWCKKMPGGEPVYLLCLEGIARRMKSLTNGNPSKTSEFCARVTANSDYQYRCQLLSALRFAYYYPSPKALLACDGLPSAQLKTCRERTEAEDKRLIMSGGKYTQQSPEVEIE